MDAKADTTSRSTPTPARQPGELSPGAVKALKIAIVVMGIMIVLGVLAVIGRIVYLAGSGGQQGAVVSKPGPDARVGLPAGAQVRQMVLEGNRIALYHDGAGGPGITVIDLTTGQVLNRIVLTPEAPRP